MANRTFLNDDELIEARSRLKAEKPSSVRRDFLLDEPQNFSRWLSEKLFARMAAHPLWLESRPVLLGSWAREELCPKSDIDLLFLGPEKKVKALADDFNAEGLKLRYRVPADRDDWTINVEPFDILALFKARALAPKDQERLDDQIALIKNRGTSYVHELCKAMFAERAARAKRYDSIANFLEPNLKHGAGGLRDLEQGLLLQFLFDLPEVEARRLSSFKSFFLMIRHYLHLNDGADVLLSSMQKDLSGFLGYESTQTFMSDLEYSLSEVSFYADWFAELVMKPRNSAQNLGRRSKKLATVNTVEEAFRLLSKDSSMAAQKLVRDAATTLTGAALEKNKSLGENLKKYFNSEMKISSLEGFFRSQILARVIPNLERLAGHVQHDQYHRYSVDAHTFQATREVLRLKKKPKILGALTPYVRKLSASDWEVLLWTALYHDLGKGLDGDHSTQGAGIVKKDFVRFGLPLKLTTLVTWMVQNHLLISHAAFRRNVQDPAVWADLFKRGVKDGRIALLTVFTAIDIRATNPDAWNEWKQKLLLQLADALTSPPASRLNDLLEYATKKKVKLSSDFVEHLDPAVVTEIPRAALIKDYKSLLKSKNDLPPLLVSARRGEIWIRLHSKIDRPGLFLDFVARLHSAGLNVQEAFVQTYEHIGAYDWFKVRSDRPLPALKILLKNSRASSEPESSVKVEFSVIEVVTENENSVTLSFRGRDQRGALVAAARAIHAVGFDILSAKVHTWGRQIDDIFTLKKPTNVAFGELISRLRRQT
jgi:[protein-PII] uridylyltransferase